LKKKRAIPPSGGGAPFSISKKKVAGSEGQRQPSKKWSLSPTEKKSTAHETPIETECKGEARVRKKKKGKNEHPLLAHPAQGGKRGTTCSIVKGGKI